MKTMYVRKEFKKNGMYFYVLYKEIFSSFLFASILNLLWSELFISSILEVIKHGLSRYLKTTLSLFSAIFERS